MPSRERRDEETPQVNIADAFRALPLDEQLSHLPGLLDTVLASEKREQVVYYLEALLHKVAPERSPFHVSWEQVANTHAFTADELAQLSDDDFGDMGQRMEAHYRQDWYPEEIVFHTQAMLDAKTKAKNP